VVLADPERDAYDVLRRVTEAPQMSHDLVRRVKVTLCAVGDHILDEEGVWLITDLASKQTHTNK